MAIDYSTISFERRRTPTLARMWFQLNSYGWPREFGPKQSLEYDDTIALMNHLAREIGKRVILGDTDARNEAIRLNGKHRK